MIRMEIRDQIILVTGGARGLGLAITHALIREGARVVVNYFNSEESAQQLAREHAEQVFIYKADVTDEDQVNLMFKKAKLHYGHAITSVINNALLSFKFDGDLRPKVEALSWHSMQQQLDSAVKAALNTTQAALEDMKKDHFGRIINIGTNLVQNPVVPYHDYTAAKAALLAFTRTTSHDLGHATPDQVFDLIAASTPLQEVTTPEQFADAILLFLSPWSRAVTGQNLIVDGGLVKG
ncbi:hypothetical protein FQR65_LT19379 [Abscondita terminalis]|nr:hypothetical protein FQR65_LT19379 [Abscondita terminalis]